MKIRQRLGVFQISAPQQEEEQQQQHQQQQRLSFLDLTAIAAGKNSESTAPSARVKCKPQASVGQNRV